MSANDEPFLSDKERLDRLRLIRSQHVGPVTFHQLLGRFGSATAAIDALPDLVRRGGRTKLPKICSTGKASREMEFYAKSCGQVVFWGDRDYPPRLSVLVDAPPVLSLYGHAPLLKKKSVAIVGARNASSNGCQFAKEISAAIGDAGYLVVSGMARGIDAAAHHGALESGTVAVLGCGVDVIYPHHNANLYGSIIELGAVVSEVPPGTQPAARHFPRRNRIISGMARGVVVVEASLRSGSLITARLAGEQGREVFAVPGAAADPRGRGTNSLIRDGAVLTESANDVLSVLDNLPQDALAAACPEKQDIDYTVIEPPADLRDSILSALGPAPTPRDNLIRQLDAPAGAVSTVLLELELAGRLENHPGNAVSLVAGD